MAVVKKIKSVKSSDHLYNSIYYITNPSKSSQVSYVNCFKGDAYNLSKQFHTTRALANKNDKILSHHFSQSFAPEDNITPAQAHELALEFVQKFAQNYQVVISTHIDKDHIHNHFIVNSVNPITNKKFIDNKASLEFMRKESDKLCYKYLTNVIEKESKYKSIDQTTYQLGMQGKSWKINLTKDLDEALDTCKNKDEFIKFFEDKDYSIKYRDIHITIQKKAEKKGIRVNTLAKQFGDKYSKKNIDNILGVVPNINSEKKIKKKSNNSYSSEYERYEKEFFNNPDNLKDFSAKWTTNKLKFNSNPIKFTLNLIKYIFLGNKTKHVANRKKAIYKSKPLSPSQNFKYGKRYENISLQDLKNASGETAKIKIYAYQLPKLLSQPFFYSSYIDFKTGIATVYLKEKDLTKLSSALNLSDEKFFIKQNESIKNKKIYYKIKNECNKPEYLLVNEEQKKLLSERFVQFAYFEKDEKYNIVFLPKEKEKIFNILYPQEITKIKKETSYQKNGRINAELKQTAKETGQQLMYKIISPTILHELENTDIKFASFRKENGTINIVYLEVDNFKIQEILINHDKNKQQKR